MTRAMTFYLSLLPLLLCIVSCGAPDSDELKPPDWIQGAWRGQNLEISSNATKADGELQWIFEHRNGTITKKAHHNSGSQWLSEFDCTEIEKTNAVYSVSVSFSALNENPTEVWRWERTTQNSITFSPLYGRASLTIPLTKETWIEVRLARLKDFVLGLLSGNSDDDTKPSPPDWIKGIWRGQGYLVMDNVVKEDGQLRHKFAGNEVVISKKGGLVPGEVNVSDLDYTEVENSDKVYSVRIRVPAFFENPTEVWRWQKVAPDTLQFWPLYGRNPLMISLHLW